MRIDNSFAGCRQFLDAVDATGLSVDELWLRYVALGGDAGEVEAFLSGLMLMTPLQHDILAHAVNERLDEIAPPRAPCSGDLRGGEDASDR